MSGDKRPRGEAHPRATLTEDAVRAIRAAGSHISNRALAREHRCSPATVSLIRRGKLWTHVIVGEPATLTIFDADEQEPDTDA